MPFPTVTQDIHFIVKVMSKTPMTFISNARCLAKEHSLLMIDKNFLIIEESTPKDSNQYKLLISQ